VVSQEPTKPFEESNYKTKERFMDEKIGRVHQKIRASSPEKKP